MSDKAIKDMSKDELIEELKRLHIETEKTISSLEEEVNKIIERRYFPYKEKSEYEEEKND